MLAAAPAGAQDDARRARLRVRLPADARLVIDGKKTTQTGTIRYFYSPPLEAGKRYHYTLQWTYKEDGKRLLWRKLVVHVRAGEETPVDLRKEDVGEKSKPPVGNEDEPDKKKEDSKKPERKLDVDYVPTPQEVVDKMLELAAVKKADVVYDLGCGDGRIVVTAAKRFGCKAVGFDKDPQRVREAKDNAKAKDVEDLVTIEEKDLFKVDLKPASVVTLYLLPEVNVKLIPQLEKLKAGSRIVSHDFKMEGVKPKKEESVTDKEGRKHTIYLWEAPIKKE